MSEKAVAPHSSTLAWKIPWMEKPIGLQSMGSWRLGHNWVTSLSLFTFMNWRRKWQPTPVFLPGESQGRGSLVGCRLWGRTVGHDWSNLAAAVCTTWTWAWGNLGRRWRPGKPAVLQSMGSQRVKCDLGTEQHRIFFIHSCELLGRFHVLASQIVLQWILGCVYLFKWWVSSDICPGVGLLNDVVVLYLVFKGASILFIKKSRIMPFAATWMDLGDDHVE